MLKCGRNKRTTKIRYYCAKLRTVISVCVQESPILAHVSNRPLCTCGTNIISCTTGLCVRYAPTLSHVSDRPLCTTGTNIISSFRQATVYKRHQPNIISCVRPATMYNRHQHYLKCPTSHCVQEVPTLSDVSDKPLCTRSTNTKTTLPFC
jgi:hypothetical protein